MARTSTRQNWVQTRRHTSGVISGLGPPSHRESNGTIYIDRSDLTVWIFENGIWTRIGSLTNIPPSSPTSQTNPSTMVHPSLTRTIPFQIGQVGSVFGLLTTTTRPLPLLNTITLMPTSTAFMAGQITGIPTTLR